MDKPNYGTYEPFVLVSFSSLIGLFVLLFIISHSLLAKCVALIFMFGLGSILLFLILDSRSSVRIKLREAIIRIAKPSENDVILDVGTGRGLFAIGFAKTLQSCQVIGIDIWSDHSLSGNCVENAIKNSVLEGVSEKATFGKADTRYLPFSSNVFNIVISGFVLSYLTNEWRKALNEITRVLNERGKLFIVDVDRGPWGSAKQLRQTLRILGLKNIQSYAIVKNAHITSAVKDIG